MRIFAARSAVTFEQDSARAARPPFALTRVMRLAGETLVILVLATEFLRLLDGRDSTVAAIASLLGDSEPEVRFWATFALGERRDASMMPAVERVAKRRQGED